MFVNFAKCMGFLDTMESENWKKIKEIWEQDVRAMKHLNRFYHVWWRNIHTSYIVYGNNE